MIHSTGNIIALGMISWLYHYSSWWLSHPSETWHDLHIGSWNPKLLDEHIINTSLSCHHLVIVSWWFVLYPRKGQTNLRCVFGNQRTFNGSKIAHDWWLFIVPPFLTSIAMSSHFGHCSARCCSRRTSESRLLRCCSSSPHCYFPKILT